MDVNEVEPVPSHQPAGVQGLGQQRRHPRQRQASAPGGSRPPLPSASSGSSARALRPRAGLDGQPEEGQALSTRGTGLGAARAGAWAAWVSSFWNKVPSSHWGCESPPEVPAGPCLAPDRPAWTPCGTVDRGSSHVWLGPVCSQCGVGSLAVGVLEGCAVCVFRNPGSVRPGRAPAGRGQAQVDPALSHRGSEILGPPLACPDHGDPRSPQGLARGSSELVF